MSKPVKIISGKGLGRRLLKSVKQMKAGNRSRVTKVQGRARSQYLSDGQTQAVMPFAIAKVTAACFRR